MNRELLMLVDAISREKSVDREVVFGAGEAARDVAVVAVGGAGRHAQATEIEQGEPIPAHVVEVVHSPVEQLEGLEVP